MSDLLGIDFAWTQPSAAAAKERSYFFGLGYLSRDSTKNLKPATIADYHGQGLGVGAFWETTVHMAEGGAAAGIRDAEDAYAQFHALGFPAGCCVYFAVDEQVPVGLIAPYFQAIAQAANNWGYRHGVYGSLMVVEGVLAHGWASLGCQTSAWSNGQVSGKAALYQRQKHTRPQIAGVAANAYDEEIQLGADAGLWLPGSPTPPPPKPAPAQVNRTQIRALQAAVRVTVDGQWGPVTDRTLMLVRAAAHLWQIPKNCRPLQHAVGATEDGIWGPRSLAALVTTVRTIQEALGVAVDGAWGVETDHWFSIVRYCDNGK